MNIADIIKEGIRPFKVIIIRQGSRDGGSFADIVADALKSAAKEVKVKIEMAETFDDAVWFLEEGDVDVIVFISRKMLTQAEIYGGSAKIVLFTSNFGKYDSRNKRIVIAEKKTGPGAAAQIRQAVLGPPLAIAVN